MESCKFRCFRFKGKKKINISVLIKVLLDTDQALFKKAFSKFSYRSYEEFYEIIDIVDSGYVSDERKQLIAKLLDYRIKCIEKWIKEGDGR